MSTNEDSITPWQRYKQKNGVTPMDLFNSKTEFLPEEESKKRLDICHGCEHLIKITSQCKKCGCFMAMKTKMAKATCPIGKW